MGSGAGGETSGQRIVVGRRWMFDGGKSPDKESSGGGNDWAYKISKSVEDAMQKASTQVVSTTRDMAQKASQQVSSVGEEALKSAKAQTEKKIKEASESSKEMSKNASKSVMSSSQQAMKASRDYVKSRTDKIAKQVSDTNVISASKKFAKSASDKVIKSGKDTMHATVDYASTSAKEAAQKAASLAKSQITDFSFSLQLFLRSVLWWALAAIGVYGIATTLPVELFRYVTRREEKVDEESRKGK
mgnify:CR=1 FL=1